MLLFPEFKKWSEFRSWRKFRCNENFNKSKFLKKVEKTDENAPSLIEIENREGFFVETSSIYDKFLKRPGNLKHITLVQWCKRYAPSRKKKDLSESDGEEEMNSFQNCSSSSSTKEFNSIHDDFIIAFDPSKRIPLPSTVELQGNFYQGEPRFLRLRKPCAVRYHKFKRESQPHEYFYSELELYHNFENPQDREKCQEDFNCEDGE